MPKLIEHISWTDDERIEKASLRRRLFPLELDIKDPITVIVGRNATGKTRLLRNIQNVADADYNIRKAQFEGDSFRLDHARTERSRLHLDITSAPDAGSYVVHLLRQDQILSDGECNGDMLQLASHWMSSGEARITLMVRISNTANSLREDGIHGVMLLDELDDGMDYKTQTKFANVLKKASDILQFIVVSHNIPFISNFNEVFDIETKSYMRTSAYLSKILPKKTLEDIVRLRK